MTGTVIKMPGTREAPKSVRSVMDTILLTPAAISRWRRPFFQREQRMTPKVMKLVEELRENGGVIPGVLTLGKMGGETYLIDGQHRLAAFAEAGLAEGIADVRICHFDTMAEMSKEFGDLNSSLVRMKTEDILRAAEANNPHLASIRKRCPFIGYDHVRIAPPGTKAKTLVSMAVAVRTWFGSEHTPTTGPASPLAAEMLNDEHVASIVGFFNSCFEAWGADRENYKLWGALTLSVLMWMYRRLVLKMDPVQRHGGSRPLHLTREQWVACLMSLSANANYVDWLVGRNLGDRDRTPAYTRIRDTFARRLVDMGVANPRLPKADW